MRSVVAALSVWPRHKSAEERISGPSLLGDGKIQLASIGHIEEKVFCLQKGCCEYVLTCAVVVSERSRVAIGIKIVESAKVRLSQSTLDAAL